MPGEGDIREGAGDDVPYISKYAANAGTNASRVNNLALATGTCSGHHGEILQGSFSGAGRALMTLPLRDVVSTATFRPDRHDTAIVTTPAEYGNAGVAARRTLDLLGLTDLGGALDISSSLPVAKGFGSSSCDIVATVRAVARSQGRTLRPAAIAAIAVTVEKASDPLMHDTQNVLFAQRAGRVIRVLPDLPPMFVLGCDSAPADMGVVTETMTLPAYSRRELRTFDHLLDRSDRALQDQDLTALGRIATTSAEINSRHLLNRLLPYAIEVAESCGAKGVQVAHSGTLIGLLFAAGGDAASQAEEARRLLAQHGAHAFRTFNVMPKGSRAAR